MGKVAVWTNYGLDGACAFLLLNILKSSNIEYYITTPKKFREDFLKWQFTTSLSNYSSVFILDVDLSKSIDVVDKDNVIIIDTHSTHVDKKHLYSKAKTVLNKTSSTSKLILKAFETELQKHITDKQRHLVALVNDFVSGNRKVSASTGINAVYWSYTGDKLQKFVNDFGKGFTEFSIQHQNVIDIHYKRLAQTLARLDLFTGRLPIKNTVYKIISTFCDSSYDEIAAHLISEHNCDIVALVNIKSKYVFYICKKDCTLSMVKLAETLGGGGGGSDTSATGDLTEAFIKLTKTFTQIC